MTAEQLKTIEAELQKRGYKKWTTALTSSEDWAWFKTFGKKQDENGEVTHGYQITFRVWDGSKYPGCPKEHPYGFDFWTSALGADSRMNFESNWEPIAITAELLEELGFEERRREYQYGSPDVWYIDPEAAQSEKEHSLVVPKTTFIPLTKIGRPDLWTINVVVCDKPMRTGEYTCRYLHEAEAFLALHGVELIPD